MKYTLDNIHSSRKVDYPISSLMWKDKGSLQINWTLTSALFRICFLHTVADLFRVNIWLDSDLKMFTQKKVKQVPWKPGKNKADQNWLALHMGSVLCRLASNLYRDWGEYCICLKKQMLEYTALNPWGCFGGYLHKSTIDLLEPKRSDSWSPW